MKFLLHSAVLLFLVLSSFSNAQNPSLNQEFDSLKESIKHSTYFDSSAVFNNGKQAIEIARELSDKSKESQIYQYYGSYFFHSGNFEQANKYYDTSVVLASQAEDSSMLISTKIRKAFVLSNKDSYKAEREFKKLLSYSENNRQNRLECLNGLALLYEERGEDSEALEYYLKALVEAEAKDDEKFIGILLNNIGLIKLGNEQYSDALSDFERALIYSEKVGEIRLTYNIQNNIGLIYYSKNEYENAAKHYKKTLLHAKKIGFPYAISVAHLNLSNSYNLIDETEKSLKHADSALVYMEKASDSTNYPLVAFLRGASYRKLQEYNKAEKAVLEGIKYAKSQNKLSQIRDGYEILYKVYEDEKNYKNAFNSLNKFHEFNDSIREKRNKQKLAELQVAYKTEKQERELQEEKSKSQLLENEKQIVEQEKKITESRLIAILLVSVFIIGATIFIFYARSQNISKKQQRKFSQDLLEAIDIERRRIARDLHDGIGQSLSYVKSKLQQVGDFESERDNLKNNIGNVIEQTRNISHSLHPAYLKNIGIKASIESLLDKVEETENIITSYELDKSIEQLPLETKTQVYRIIQESINNTLKHANAKSIRLIIEKKDQKFNLTYKDNGDGMVINKSKSFGIGMMTMKERAHKINGKIFFSSEPQKGFKLNLIF